MIELSPYVEGYYFQRVEILIDHDPEVWSVELNGDRVLRFRGERYRPAPGQSDEQMAEEILDFIAAYLERPEEFDREGEIEREPGNLEWWTQHIETLHYEAMALAGGGDE